MIRGAEEIKSVKPFSENDRRDSVTFKKEELLNQFGDEEIPNKYRNIVGIWMLESSENFENFMFSLGQVYTSSQEGRLWGVVASQTLKRLKV